MNVVMLPLTGRCNSGVFYKARRAYIVKECFYAATSDSKQPTIWPAIVFDVSPLPAVSLCILHYTGLTTALLKRQPDAVISAQGVSSPSHHPGSAQPHRTW
jgi:hypothetical protein